MSNAWFDYPSTDNKAHSAAECSNRGGCDRETGECACQRLHGGGLPPHGVP